MHGAGPAPQGCSMQSPKPPGRSLMSVRGNAAPRGMTAHDRIRLTGPFADFFLSWRGASSVAEQNDSPGREASRPGLTIFDPQSPICACKAFESGELALRQRLASARILSHGPA